MANAGVANITKLQSEQEKALLECQGKISQWKKFHNDYVVLQKRLETLPDKLSHDVMVPFGSVAFMPGQLVRTNEIMVLLGDNWFVDRSAKQACSLVERRLKKCEETLRSLEMELQQFQNWKKYTSTVKEEAKQFVEIVENYDEESERTWRETHKIRLKQHREKQQSSSSAGVSDDANKLGTEAVSYTSDDEFWLRLDELEMEEFEARQIESNASISRQHFESQADPLLAFGNDQGGGPIRRSDSDVEKRVAWKEDLLSERIIPQPGAVLRVNFSEGDATTSGSSPILDTKIKSDSPGCSVQSPADIYALFGTGQEAQSQPKSILKKSTPAPVCQSQSGTTRNSPVLTTPVTEISPEIEAVSTIVIERANDQLKTAIVTTAPKRVSKFKSQRQAKNS